jgi:hypothetical protein
MFVAWLKVFVALTVPRQLLYKNPIPVLYKIPGTKKNFQKSGKSVAKNTGGKASNAGNS